MAALLAFGGIAGAADCPAAPAPAIHLDSAIAQPQWRYDRTRAEISRLAGRSGGDRSEAGLTRVETEFRVEPRLRLVGLPGGGTCVALAEVRARWAISSIVVDVAADYPRNTCPHREIVDHESEHVEISRRAFRNHVPRLRARLADLVARTPQVVARDDGHAAADKMAEDLLKGVQPTLDAHMAEAKRANATIDTPENYARLSARCADW